MIGLGSDNKTCIVITVLAIVKELSHLATWQAQLETLKMDFQEKKVNKNSFIEECEVVHDLKRIEISFEMSRFFFFLEKMFFLFHNAAPLLAS